MIFEKGGPGWVKGGQGGQGGSWGGGGQCHTDRKMRNVLHRQKILETFRTDKEKCSAQTH